MRDPIVEGGVQVPETRIKASVRWTGSNWQLTRRLRPSSLMRVEDGVKQVCRKRKKVTKEVLEWLTIELA